MKVKNVKRINNKIISIVAFFVLLIAVGSYCYVNGADYVFSETEDKIYNTLIAAGYSKAGACGILGNMAVENSAFEPDLYGNGGITYGLFQWNNVGERKDNLVKWCNNRKLYHNRVEGQLAFAMHEIEGGDPIAKRLERFLKTTENPRDAAMEFTTGFERCVGASPVPETDARYEGSIYPEYYGKTYQAMAKRMAMAEKYYEAYYTEDENPSLVFKVDATPTPGLVSEVEEKMQSDLQTKLNLYVDATLANDKVRLAGLRFACMAVGYLCGCFFIVVFLVDRKTIKENRSKKMKEIPHFRSAMNHFGTKRAILILINDIAKLCIAIAISTVFVKGLSIDEKMLYTGFGVILGNAYPFWNRFRGGVGMTVTVLTLMLYMPIWGVLSCIIGIYIAMTFKILTLGAVTMSLCMIPFAFLYKGVEAGIVVTLILLTLVISHQRVLLRYFDRKVLRSHYKSRFSTAS